MLTLVTTASNECGLRLRANNHSVFLLVKRDDTAIISRIYPHSSYNDSLQTSNKRLIFFITRTSRAHSSIRSRGRKKTFDRQNVHLVISHRSVFVNHPFTNFPLTERGYPAESHNNYHFGPFGFQRARNVILAYGGSSKNNRCTANSN